MANCGCCFLIVNLVYVGQKPRTIYYPIDVLLSRAYPRLDLRPWSNFSFSLVQIMLGPRTLRLFTHAIVSHQMFVFSLHSRIIEPKPLSQANTDFEPFVACKWLRRDLKPNKVASLRASHDAGCNSSFVLALGSKHGNVCKTVSGRVSRPGLRGDLVLPIFARFSKCVYSSRFHR